MQICIISINWFLKWQQFFNTWWSESFFTFVLDIWIEQRNVKCQDKTSHANDKDSFLFSNLCYQSIYISYSLFIYSNKQLNFLRFNWQIIQDMDIYRMNRDHSADNFCNEDFHTHNMQVVMSVMLCRSLMWETLFWEQFSSSLASVCLTNYCSSCEYFRTASLFASQQSLRPWPPHSPSHPRLPPDLVGFWTWRCQNWFLYSFASYWVLSFLQYLQKNWG